MQKLTPSPRLRDGVFAWNKIMIKFPRAEFFDLFGVPVFITITLLSGWAITTGAPLPHWALLFLFFVGLFGIFIDGSIVYKTYIKKK